MPLTKQQLLIPRVLCIGTKEGEPNDTSRDYISGNIITVGDYLSNSDFLSMKATAEYLGGLVEKFPHLFKPLPWWYGRTVEEMPLYVKSHDGVYFKIKWVNSVNWMFYNDTDFIEGKYCEPATLEDYQEYQKQKQ